MAKSFTVQDFFNRFPTDDACLDHLMLIRFGSPINCPKCGKTGKFHRLRKEPAYSCAWCGHHVHPMQGTPFERTHTPLQKWFYAMYLFTTSRHGVPAKELQRQLGVTYKTAWRMGHEIRKHMTRVDGDGGLSGHVEIDETYIGGERPGTGSGTGKLIGKAIVFGMLERGGAVMTRIVPNTRKFTLAPLIMENIQRGSVVSTDEHGSYRALRHFGYRHGAVNHKAEQWVDGIHHTNSIENFWSQLKRSIRGTHIHVSAKHLPKYLGKFEYRFNMRKAPVEMFTRLLASF
jgi:transposase